VGVVTRRFIKKESEHIDQSDELARFLSNLENVEQPVAYEIQASNSPAPRVSYLMTVMLNGTLTLLHEDKDHRFSMPFNLRSIPAFQDARAWYDLTGQKRIGDLHQNGGEFSSPHENRSNEDSALNHLLAAAERFKSHGLPSKDSYHQYDGKLLDSRKPVSAIDHELAPSVKIRPAR